VVAAESLIDGCLNEGAAALLLHRLAEHAIPSLSVSLTTTAFDEEAHAELAWDILAWCYQTDPKAVSCALRVPLHIDVETVSIGDIPSSRHGVAQPLLAAQALADVTPMVIARLETIGR
jgi:hypothetical protein